MNELFSQLNALVQNNQILSTVAGGSVIVWLVTNIKSIFFHLVDGVTAIISFTVVNTYEDARNTGSGWMTQAQGFFNRFISSTKVLWERTKNLDLSDPNNLHYDKEGKPLRYSSTNVNSLTYGFSIRLVFGKIVFMRRTIDKSQKITVTTTMRVFFASKRKFMGQLKAKIEEYLKASFMESMESDIVKVFNGETCYGEKHKRGMDSIFTNNNEHIDLLDSIRTFLNNREKYEKLAYPYSYSALLYGEPGCGKTSTILAVASALNMDILYINLGKITLSKLIESLNSSTRNIIVFEDIDALTNGIVDNREKPEDGGEKDSGAEQIRSMCSSLVGISLSDLLNITDGLLASDGTICLFTTNHIERLDPAFLRSGRMNKLIEFTKLNRATAARMLKGTLGWDISPDNLKDNINPADLQAAILNVTLGRDNGDKLRHQFFVSQTT